MHYFMRYFEKNDFISRNYETNLVLNLLNLDKIYFELILIYIYIYIYFNFNFKLIQKKYA
jgi:hypothetical protein